jgi:predicted nucleic acid-binding protein
MTHLEAVRNATKIHGLIISTKIIPIIGKNIIAELKKHIRKPALKRKMGFA